MREAYRLNKHLLDNPGTEKQMAIFIIFIGKEPANFETIDQAVKKALARCSKTNLDKNWILGKKNKHKNGAK